MEETSLAPTEAKKPINIDISSGMIPHNYDELMQFSALYKGSGLAPKSFQTIQQVAIGIGMCIELRRPILTGLQDMAVINGKVSIYGDAALAQVRSSGLLEYIVETETGTPYQDGWTFTCELKRKGSPEPRKGIWTWEDAKRAGFDDPKMKDGRKDIYSPWTRFTRRMMTFKARNFVLRDEFGDVIKGMTLAEDAQDIIDVTPEPRRTLKVDTDTGEIKEGEDIYAKQEPPDGPPQEGNDETWDCHVAGCGFTAKSERGLKKHNTQSHPVPEPAPEPETQDEDPPPFEPDLPEATSAEVHAAAALRTKPPSTQISEIVREFGNGAMRRYQELIGKRKFDDLTPPEQEQVLRDMELYVDERNA
jgi:hypothetical protein